MYLHLQKTILFSQDTPADKRVVGERNTFFDLALALGTADVSNLACSRSMIGGIVGHSKWDATFKESAC